MLPASLEKINILLVVIVGLFNLGNYLRLLNLLGNYNGIFSVQYNTIKYTVVFSGSFNDFQNELIHSIKPDERKSAISKISFVAIIIDKTTDVTNNFKLSTVLCYVDKTGENSRAIQENKLIAEAYNGVAVMAGEHSDLQTLVK